MITIKPQGIDDLLSSLRGMERQIPYAEANGINELGRMVKDAETQEMKSVLSSPTPFTLSSLRLTPAKAPGSIVATVFFKDPPNLSQKDHFLLPQVEGGNRPLKPYEMGLGGKFTTPSSLLKSGAGLDQYGNLGRGQLTKILSQSGSFRDSGSNMNRTRKGGKVGDMFMLRAKRGKLLPGIYERTLGDDTGGRIGRYLLARNMGAKKSELNKHYRGLLPRGLKPVLIFPSKAPSYSKRFDFYGVAQRVIDKNMRPVMMASIDAEIRRETAYRTRKGL
jgi:hypothetical protein